MNRIDSVDVGRGMAMLMVVGSHAIEWSRADETSAPVQTLHVIFASAMLPMFFFLSGALGSRAVASTWRKMLVSRVAPLLWVFVLWQPVVFAYKFTAGQTLPEQEDTSLTAHLVRAAASFFRPSGELWFIWALAIFFIVVKLLHRVPAIAICVLAGAASLAWLSFSDVLLGASLSRLLGPGLNGLPTYFFFFVLGLFCSDITMRWMSRASSEISGRLIIVVVVWLGIVIPASIFQVFDEPILVFVIKVVGLAGGLATAVLLSRVRPLRYIGQASMPIYLTHSPLIVGSISILYATGLVGLPWPWWGMVLLVALVVPVGLIVHVLNGRGHLVWLVALPARINAWLMRVRATSAERQAL
jgi:surface polysaccharide O-acyltransferase-like enzyme